MIPRWAEKLEAQSRPQPDSYRVLRNVRLIGAFAAFSLPLGATAAEGVMAAIHAVAPAWAAACVVIAIATALVLIGLAFIPVARTWGRGGVGSVILPALGFFFGFSITLLLLVHP